MSSPSYAARLAEIEAMPEKELRMLARTLAFKQERAGRATLVRSRLDADRVWQIAARRGLLSREDDTCRALTRVLGDPPAELSPHMRGTIVCFGEEVGDAGVRASIVCALLDVEPLPSDLPHLFAWLVDPNLWRALDDVAAHPRLTRATLRALLPILITDLVSSPGMVWSLLCRRAPRAPASPNARPEVLCPPLPIEQTDQIPSARWDDETWEELARAGDALSESPASYPDSLVLGWGVLALTAPDERRAKRAWGLLERGDPTWAEDLRRAVWAAGQGRFPRPPLRPTASLRRLRL